ncbi:hypothetical protein [Pandoravirus japonicus]|uniref:Uncharacterized protein n=1 Tax=Pandoravirus japonicus TaxID=2823154 RepID=A0A811BPZ4_9VIRU|nr:hypothetical protein [Pandoravirus japonicus]
MEKKGKTERARGCLSPRRQQRAKRKGRQKKKEMKATTTSRTGVFFFVFRALRFRLRDRAVGGSATRRRVKNIKKKYSRRYKQRKTKALGRKKKAD